MASKRMIAQFVEHWMSFSARKMSQDDVKHLTESYYTAFQGYTDTEIEFASKTYCETGEFFPPKPIHIISLIKNIQETKHSKELREMWTCKRCGEKTSSITSDGICLDCAGVPKPAYKNLKPLPKPTPVNYKMEGRIKCQKCGKVEMCIQEPANTGQWLCRQCYSGLTMEQYRARINSIIATMEGKNKQVMARQNPSRVRRREPSAKKAQFNWGVEP